MDDLDRQLISLLRHDARQPVATLAADLKVSRATVRARIDRLVADGVIQGFTVRLREDGSANRVRAVMMIEVEGHRAEAILRRLYGFPEVRALHTTNGRWDVVADIETDTLENFDRLLSTIRLLDGIASTETSILLASRKG
ncbi:Lrp/AsnC family transcriptional regulator [Stappia sp. F7233]|uniref:Lrp/AsnC family transcriptional regulator n=1 Tax=Stappia albiluteola TaxID=2758565 RepID=A0A839AJR6_9HYPH|nr:Lrp/AsnC family transcriptional regulator [Stappia albiluteola]MBA5779316.1 Lrp/AsnC family transcriptional regulator [Stappia albiluteola]